MNHLHLAKEESEMAENNYQYWLARTALEMPHPDNRTLVELGKAAFILSKAAEERPEAPTGTV